MEQFMEKLEALRQRVNRPLPMDPWTYGRISEPLLDLIQRWAVSGSVQVSLCAAELSNIVRTWEKEANEVGQQMYQDHLREEIERQEAMTHEAMNFDR